MAYFQLLSPLNAFDLSLFHETTCSLEFQHTTLSCSFLTLFTVCSSFLAYLKCFLWVILFTPMTSATVSICCLFPNSIFPICVTFLIFVESYFLMTYKSQRKSALFKSSCFFRSLCALIPSSFCAPCFS